MPDGSYGSRLASDMWAFAGNSPRSVTPMQPLIRELTDDDRDANHRLGAEAFGYAPDRQSAALPPTGGAVLGSCVGDRLVAKIRAQDYLTHVPGGHVVPTLGVASVAVQAESRGTGLLSPLFHAGFERARQQRQPISTLFPTAPGIYRRFGYEVVGGLEQRLLTVADLAKVRAPEGASLRRATADDLDAVRELYAAWAADKFGPLTRTGPAQPIWSTDYLAGTATVTLAVDRDGQVVGCVRWTRGTGYDPTSSVIEVEDFIARTEDAARALWRLLASFGSVSGRVEVELPGTDEALTLLPVGPPPPSKELPYMLALLDIPAALSARRGVPGLSARLPFRVTGGFAEDVDGSYLLRAENDELRCSSAVSGDGPIFHARGLAALYGGAQRCAGLRSIGLLNGPDDHDPVWDALFNVPTHIRDYF